MKTRVIRRDGYENGAALATAWQEDGLIPAPHGEVFEFYRLVDKEAVERLGDEEGMQGPELNLLEPFAKHARLMGRERDVARVREWTEPRLLDAVGDIHRERLAEPFDPHRYPEMQGLAQFQDREAKGIADVFGTDFRRILLCQDQYRRLVYLRVSGEAEPAADGSCTSVIFKESPVGPIVGRNMDSGIGSIAGLQGFGDPVMFRFPEEMGHSYMGTALAVNEHGLTIQGSSIAYAHEPTDAGFWVDLGPLVLRSCSTTAEALDLIDRYSTMSGPSNLVMIDGAGDGAAVEKSKNTYAVRRTDTPWIFTTDGVAVEEKTAAIQGQTSLHEFHVARHRLIERLLREARVQPERGGDAPHHARPHAAVAGVQAPRPDAGGLSAGHAVQLPAGAAHRGVLLLGHPPGTRVPLHLRADPPPLLVRVAITSPPEVDGGRPYEQNTRPD